MQVIGLTGGIASGKSLATKTFEDLGITIIDADQIAKNLTTNHSPLTQTIIQHFGQQVADKHGDLNRQAIAEIIFNHQEQRQWLEQLLHPHIREQMAEAIKSASQRAQHPYCICVIPLLAEHWPHPLIHEVLLIKTDSNNQKQWLCQRDQISPEQAQKRINAQATEQQRMKIADSIIENKGDPAQFQQNITTWHKSKINHIKQKDNKK